MEPKFHKSPAYYLVAWSILLIGVMVLGELAMTALTRPAFLSSDDYVEYWSAARLNLSGGNPYGPEQLAPLQIAAGRTRDVPLMMWNPPWTLTLLMPLGWLPYLPSRMLWLLLSVSILLLAANWGWRTYGGDASKPWISWLVALTFSPSLHLLRFGQITLLLLLGVIGFLYFLERERWWLAGAVAALITIKPHLLYLFGLALVVWAVDRRRWALLGGFALSVVGALAIAWAVNPNLIRQYVYAVTTYPPEQWATPTLGAVLRLQLGMEKFWLQFVPPVLGVLWFLWYWRNQRATWSWVEQMPFLLLVSVITAAYGWTFDYPVVLLALMQVAVWFTKDSSWSWSKVGLLVVYIAADLVTLFLSREQLWFWWMSLWLMASYLVASYLMAPRDSFSFRS